MDKDFTQIVNDYSFRKFFDAWQRVREGDGLPARRAITLRDFAPFASDLLIYQLRSPDNLACRLMGGRVSDRVKINGLDINWLDLVASDMREAGELWWGNLVGTPCAGLMQFSTAFLNGTNRISRALLLPMEHAPGKIHLLAMATASEVFNPEGPREQLLVARDCFQTKYLDIGFGLPKNALESENHKALDTAVADKIFF